MTTPGATQQVGGRSVPRIEIAPDRPAWERQPGESPARFDRFTSWRCHGGTLDDWASAEGISASRAYTLSSEGHWVERRGAWTDYQRRQEDREILERNRRTRQALADRSARLADLCFDRAEQAATENGKGALNGRDAAHAAAEHARVHHLLTTDGAPVVQVTATASAISASASDHAEDQAHGRSDALRDQLLAAAVADVRHAANVTPQSAAADSLVQGPGVTEPAETRPKIRRSFLDILNGDDEDDDEDDDAVGPGW
ncbi:hypothetical protein AB0G95_21795 [Streptomyces virginiae]|uniref:hypothetical protein n=1 Tax=Streptomyces virginiae TaxID=1961 RepID=UPI003435A5C3